MAFATTSSHQQQQQQQQQQPSQASFSRARHAMDIITTGGLGHEIDSAPPTPITSEVESAVLANSQQYEAGATKSLSGIALRAFALGTVFTLFSLISLSIVLFTASPAWRAPLFVALVAGFHFLEFWTTAEYNTSQASISSYLLTTNGLPYALATTFAPLESLLTTFFFPSSPLLSTPITILGLALALGMQYIRTLAIVTAGRSFNHIVQSRKASSHVLISHGIYKYLRHPSYFGYFWWGMGTQLMLGNMVCLGLYAVALWFFFARRIPGEEKGLVRFFGDDYVRYKKNTWVGIPFIR